MGLLSPSWVRTSLVLAQLPQVGSQAKNKEDKPEEVVDTEVNTPVVPDTGVDNIGVVDPIVKKPAAKISDKVIVETKEIRLPVSNKPGQISTQAYICLLTIWQNFSTAPDVTYGAYVACTAGVPYNIQLMLERSNVNTPYNYLQSSKAPTHFCSGSSFCQTPTYKHTVSGTKHLHATAIATWIGTEGEVVGSPKVRATWHYNDVGKAYPRVQLPQPGPSEYVPFPYDPPYNVCPDGSVPPPSCYRDPDFPKNVEAYYRLKQWVIPTGSKIEVHHIKPLRWGGDNYVQNGVILTHTDHLPFTKWWRKFNPRVW
ncbi:HNH endonuclease [Gloeocapsopsis dulcis]|uniref:HNH endonuclease signature motif containing protein n=1 Tax=Gloeocapsopsis dulcis TaxID=2859516 RepID=UPI00101AD72B|nr:HNH endonuclease [Gloeocapsopsis dulcis]WNN91187.1 HNH endonuclease [Gloeocapsopsis dulcis]